jgi:hypothetical protein
LAGTAKREAEQLGFEEDERRPESEWLRVPQPGMAHRIGGSLNAAHVRLAAAAQTYLRHNGGHLWGRPATGLEARYLLSGIARCACCGASMVGHPYTKGRTRTYSYICGTYSRRGPTVCANRIGVPMPGADAEVIAQLLDHVLGDRELVDGAIADAIAELCPTADTADAQREVLRRELRDVVQAQARLIDAITTAGDVAALAAALTQKETRRTELSRALAAVNEQARSAAGRPAAHRA